MQTPPNLGSKKPKDIKDVAKLGWALRKQVDQQTVADITRLFTMSATDLLDRWFESPQMMGFMAVNGIIGTWAGPDAPGTAYVMMHHSVGDIGDGEVACLGLHGRRHGRRREGVRGLGPVLRRRDPRERAGRHDPDRRRARSRRDPRER